MRPVLILLLTLLSCQSYSQTQQFTLDNGLKVVVKEDHRAPVAVAMIWYNVGSADEPGGITGISHALEHLMFKGTEKFPLGVFSKTIAALGGQENAFTNNDYTAYFEKIATPHLKTSFELEADRMQNLLLDKEEFGKEIKVIQEERRLRTDDNPQALTFERFMAAAHLASPYHHPVIGWMSDLEQMSVEDARAWHQKYYAPNNATLVVVGDVIPAQVYELAKTYFGKIPARTSAPRKLQLEPPALGKKTIEVHAPAQIPMLMLGYTVPSVKTTSPENEVEPYALEILAGILDAGDSGRFTKNLVRGKQIASTADIYYNLYTRYQTQFILYGTPSQGHTLDDLRKGFLAEIERLKTEKISEPELQRVKTQIIAQKTFEKDSIFGQAMEIGLLETIGLGWQTADRYVERINRVTPEQLQRAAQRYFAENYLTEARLIPES
ncbi:MULTISPECIES: M16 family metallopeptidase [Legionella]|uniref:Insulinase family protein n=1 Tax=Legionella septentrionalis TaxID=2498109 RepID=A0A3S1CMA3_9GAMM|nr:MULTISPECIES: pitrilysin family protein [Legionella]MCP0914590.1 insulinase family protein [Legionella sp. 27cVA30]RUQ90048.1 insulinase family protein [Legionella septentrionalis]RUQ96182.1 insulinase family protein [Legionella septentrionalis]